MYFFSAFLTFNFGIELRTNDLQIENMKYLGTKSLILLFVLITTLSSCEAIASIFKAGVWVGVLIVVVIIGIILWLIGKARK